MFSTGEYTGKQAMAHVGMVKIHAAIQEHGRDNVAAAVGLKTPSFNVALATLERESGNPWQSGAPNARARSEKSNKKSVIIQTAIPPRVIGWLDAMVNGGCPVDDGERKFLVEEFIVKDNKDWNSMVARLGNQEKSELELWLGKPLTADDRMYAAREAVNKILADAADLAEKLGMENWSRDIMALMRE